MRTLEETVTEHPSLSAGTDAKVLYQKLTEREQGVFHLVARGFTAPEIGRMLLISPKTVDTYKQRINEKLTLSHRSEYVALALSLGLLRQGTT